MGLILSPLIWRITLPSALVAAGTVVLVVAALWMAYGYRSLGTSHSSWVVPIAGGKVVTGGAYAIVRHPIYAGWIDLAFGWSLVTSSPLALGLAVALVTFYDRRARTEERRLEAVYPAYAAYRRQVKRFVPRIY